MLTEAPNLTDIIYIYLLENEMNLYHSLPHEDFGALIQRQYDEIMDGVY